MRAKLAILVLLTLSTIACGHVLRPDLRDEDPRLTALENLPPPAGISETDWQALKDALASLIADPARLASAAPITDASASVLSLSDNGATVTLNWSFASQGDYDQNGEVNISDLTALGANFLASTGGGPFPYDSALSVVDGDSNGEINISDVTPIAINLGNSLTGYRVYSSAVFTDIPQGNELLNGPDAQMLGSVEITSASGSGRKAFTFTTSDNPAGAYYWVRPSDGTVEGTASNYTVPSGATLLDSGGAVDLNGIQLDVNPLDLSGAVKFTISSVAPPAGLPPDAAALSAYEITPDHPEFINAPVTMTIPYDDSALAGDEEGVMVFHYTGSEYEPMTMLARDTVLNTVTVNSRVFSTFTVVHVAGEVLDALASAYNVGFNPATNGWSIPNFGSYLSPGGNCLGMSAYACWFFSTLAPDPLATKFSTAGGEPVSIAHLVAQRAMLAQSQLWANIADLFERTTFSDREISRLMKYNLVAFHKPLVLLLLGNGGHACVLYGWDSTGLLFYDVNYPNQAQHLFISPIGFLPYEDYVRFGYAAQSTVGRGIDFANLTVQAIGGFATSEYLTLTKPEAYSTIPNYLASIQGTLSGPISGADELACYVNGQRQLVPVSGGSFSASIASKNGPNTLVLIAGDNLDNSWFTDCVTLVRRFTSTVSGADLVVTLTWNKPKANCDLIVYEPNWWLLGPGYVAYPGQVATFNGLVHWGSSPYINSEVVTLHGNLGNTVVPGNYRIQVHYSGYWYDVDPGPVTGTVTVLTHEGMANQELKQYNFGISQWDPDATNNWYERQSQGPYWADIGFVRLLDL